MTSYRAYTFYVNTNGSNRHHPKTDETWGVHDI